MSRWLRNARRRIICLSAAVAVPLLAGVFTPAAADFKVLSPIVTKGEFEIESAGSVTRGRHRDGEEHQSYTTSLGNTFTDFWQAELEGELSQEPDEGLKYAATNFENIFQILPQGEYWLDLGLLAEYSRAKRAGANDAVEFGPLLQKQFGDFLTTLNVTLEKQIGSRSEAGTEIGYGFQARYRWWPGLEPGIEVFGDMGEITHLKAADRQAHRAGPVLFGTLRLGNGGKIKYEAGYLIGLTRNTPDGTVKFLLEYEVAF